jgi:ribosomal protein S18 acetylase RimI-like enzyme
VALRFAVLDTRRHQRANFRCGVPVLDAYLQQQASQHQCDGIATTHVLIDGRDPIHTLGYCSLAAAQLTLQDLQPAYPVPAVRLGRLAVASEAHRRGYGRLLLGHAVNCSLALRGQLGVRVLVVDALDERAAAFYRALSPPSLDARVTSWRAGRRSNGCPHRSRLRATDRRSR